DTSNLVSMKNASSSALLTVSTSVAGIPDGRRMPLSLVGRGNMRSCMGHSDERVEVDPFHVAFMLHGAAGSEWWPLKLLEKIMQHTRHENGRNRTGLIRSFSCAFKVVGEVGLEPTKA